MTSQVSPCSYRFGGRFELQPAQRRLLVSGNAAPVGERAFNVLVILVERAGRLVTRGELLERVWVQRVVEENNLDVQITKLRKLLGSEAIESERRYGYHFTLPVDAIVPDLRADFPPLKKPGARPNNLPAQTASTADILDELRPELGIQISMAAAGESWNVFISHAHEDKEAIGTPLAAELQLRGLRVRYDFSLKLGDSLRRSIDRGLARSRFGIVILSPRFFEKEWPQKELDGSVAREADGHRVILPVWHEINAETMRRFSPILADRVGVRSTTGIAAVADAVVAAMGTPIVYVEKAVTVPTAASAKASPSMTSEARTLLVAASRDQAGVLQRVRRTSGTVVRVSGQDFVSGGDPRSAATWSGAVDELLGLNLLELRPGSSVNHYVTKAGFDAADELT